MTAATLTLADAARMIRDAITDRSYQRETRLGGDVAKYLAWARMNLAARSLEIYEGYLARLCITLADRDPSVADVTPEMLLSALDEYPDGSLAIVRTSYNNLFKWAVLWGHRPDNPVDKLPRRRRKTEKVYEVFTAAEQARIVKATDAMVMPRLQRLRALCFVELGVRKDEARWFQPRHFDTVAKVVVVDHAKGGKERVVPMGDDLWRAYVQYRNTPVPSVVMEDERGRYHEDRLPLDDDWLFFPYGATKTGLVTWTNPRKQHAERSVHNWWEAVIDAADVKYRSLHMNRHTVGTDLATAETDAFTIRDWLGHADVSTTQVYVHNSRSRLAKGRDRLDEFRKGQQA